MTSPSTADKHVAAQAAATGLQSRTNLAGEDKTVASAARLAPPAEERFACAAHAAGPSGIDVGGVDEVAAAAHVGVEAGKRSRFISITNTVAGNQVPCVAGLDRVKFASEPALVSVGTVR